MYFIYTSILYALVPFVLLRLLWLSRKTPAYRQRWLERFGYVDSLVSEKKVIWIHAVSVGEIHASKPLVEFIRSHFMDYQLLITTVTPSGAATAGKIFAGSVQHRYFPYDLPFAVSRFLETVKPHILLILETEIWPNLYRQCRKSNIPILLLNARLSARSLKGYQMVKALTASTLEDTTVIAAQSTPDAERFIQAGAPADKLMVMGNLKFDISIAPSVIEQAEVLRRIFSVNRPIWIAASTHLGEELIVLDAMELVLNVAPDILLILVPRHPERFDDVYDLCVKQGFKTASYTNQSAYGPKTQVFVLDVLGQLPAYYAASDVAFVGGSLIPIGGHNLLEPACLGLPIVCGTHLFNFYEISSLLGDVDALFKVADAEQLSQRILELFNDGNLRYNMGQRAKQVVMDNQGSINRIGKLLQQYI